MKPGPGANAWQAATDTARDAWEHTARDAGRAHQTRARLVAAHRTHRADTAHNARPCVPCPRGVCRVLQVRAASRRSVPSGFGWRQQVRAPSSHIFRLVSWEVCPEGRGQPQRQQRALQCSPGSRHARESCSEGRGSAQRGSGRAVFTWFQATNRGLAMTVRQTSVPVGAGLAALALAPLAPRRARSRRARSRRGRARRGRAAADHRRGRRPGRVRRAGWDVHADRGSGGDLGSGPPGIRPGGSRARWPPRTVFADRRLQRLSLAGLLLVIRSSGARCSWWSCPTAPGCRGRRRLVARDGADARGIRPARQRDVARPGRQQATATAHRRCGRRGRVRAGRGPRPDRAR